MNLDVASKFHHFFALKVFAVTLSGSQVGNICSFPALKVGLSLSYSPRWVPHCFKPIFAQKQWNSFATSKFMKKIGGLLRMIKIFKETPQKDSLI